MIVLLGILGKLVPLGDDDVSRRKRMLKNCRIFVGFIPLIFWGFPILAQDPAAGSYSTDVARRLEQLEQEVKSLRSTLPCGSNSHRSMRTPAHTRG